MKQIEALGDQSTAAEEPQAATTGKPEYVADLEAAYGAPSQSGFGSAVFYESLAATDDLAQKALERYQYFVGDLWERYGEDAWLGPWKEVYARQAGSTPDIVAELKGNTDPDARLSMPMVLDVVENAEVARQALSAAYRSFCATRGQSAKNGQNMNFLGKAAAVAQPIAFPEPGTDQQRRFGP